MERLPSHLPTPQRMTKPWHKRLKNTPAHSGSSGLCLPGVITPMPLIWLSSDGHRHRTGKLTFTSRKRRYSRPREPSGRLCSLPRSRVDREIRGRSLQGTRQDLGIGRVRQRQVKGSVGTRLHQVKRQSSNWATSPDGAPPRWQGLRRLPQAKVVVPAHRCTVWAGRPQV